MINVKLGLNIQDLLSPVIAIWFSDQAQQTFQLNAKVDHRDDSSDTTILIARRIGFSFWFRSSVLKMYIHFSVTPFSRISLLKLSLTRLWQFLVATAQKPGQL